MYVSFGQPSFVNAWAKQAITNGYSGKFAFPEQYLEAAYTTGTNGYATTNVAGILSPYRDFFPTGPGGLALVTMPDIDTGQRGTGIVNVVKLQLDVNHDGNMDLSFGGPDNTSQSRPFVFWVNNDCDFSDDDAHKPGQDVSYYAKDCMDSFINSQRDLEDLARLWICGMPTLPADGGYQVTLGWASVSGGTPSINLFASVETNGGTGYLTDTETAVAQLASTDAFAGPGWAIARISPDQPFTFPDDFFTNRASTYFLFEGAGVGSGELVVTITQHGTNIAQTGAWLDLRDVKDLYERAVTTNTFEGAISNWSSSIRIVQRPTAAESYESEDVVVYVHGASNKTGSWLERSDTIFKRLYWAGYHGKFASVRWDSVIIADPSWFNLSELYAYKASFALSAYLSQLGSRFPSYRLHIFAHSQGGAIASEALSAGAPFDTLILSQVAMPASCYDVNAPTNSDLLSIENTVARTPDWQPMGYHGAHTNIAGRVVNYYNAADSLLGTWLTDQKYFKPTQFYTYDGTNCWYYFDPEGGGRRSVSDPQESRAQLARSRTLGIGAQGPAPGQTGQGIIQSAVNLQTQFNIGDSRDEHSAFFTRPIQTVRPFYLQILDSIEP